MCLTKREEYETRTEKILEPIMTENNFELVDVEYVKEAGNWYLRAYVDKEGGITLDDCELVNRAWSDIMDEQDFIPDAYILEDVKFYKAVKIPNPRNGKEMSVKQITGMLKEFDKDTITLETDFANEYVINRKDISTVKLTIDF